MKAMIALLLLTATASAEPHVLLDRGAGERTFRLRFEAQNPGAEPLAASFVALVPSRGCGSLVRLVSSHPGELDEVGGSVAATVHVGELPPYGAAVVTLAATLGDAPLGAPPAGVAGDDGDPIIDAALADRTIQELAEKARRATARATADAAFDLVVARITPAAFDPLPPDPVGALRSGRGDCSDMAAALVAVCRAAGVPARYVGGWRVSGSAVLDPARYHNWAEVGEGWTPMDPHGSERAPQPETCLVAAVGAAPTVTGGSPRFRPLSPGLVVKAMAPKEGTR